MVTGIVALVALVAGSAIVLARADAGTVNAPPVVGSPTGESLRVIQRDGNSALVQVGMARTAGSVAARVAADQTVDVLLTNRSGRPAAGEVETVVIDLATGEQHFVTVADGHGVVELPEGHYAFGAVIADADSVTLAYQPNVSGPGSGTVRLDARPGRRVEVSLNDSGARQVMATAFVAQHTDAGLVSFPATPVRVEDFQRTPVFVTPTGAGAGVDLLLQTVWTHNGTDGASPYVYTLSSRTTDAIPDKPNYAVRKDSLAKVVTRYDAQGTGGAAVESAFPHFGGFVGGVNAWSHGVPVALPATRIEYFTPGLTWVAIMAYGKDSDEPDTWQEMFAEKTYPRSGLFQHSWNSAPHGPAFPNTANTFTVAVRQPDDTVIAALSLYTDAQPGHASGARPYAGVTGTTELYENGKLLLSSEEPGTFGKDATATLSPAPGTYRLSVRAHRDVNFSAYATEQRIDWTFSSQHTATQQNLPLLAVRYQATLDPYGRARAGKPCTVNIWLEANSAPQQKSATTTAVRASYDDGKTWQQVQVVTRDGQTRAIFTPPRSAKFVSLRATAHDQAGNSVDQTVIRAFGLT
jgi:hypothetical protein